MVVWLTLSPANEQILDEIRRNNDQPEHPHYIRKYETLFRLLHKANEEAPNFDVYTIEVEGITVFRCNRLVGRLYIKILKASILTLGIKPAAFSRAFE